MLSDEFSEEVHEMGFGSQFQCPNYNQETIDKIVKIAPKIAWFTFHNKVLKDVPRLHGLWKKIIEGATRGGTKLWLMGKYGRNLL
jgi:hypothetical protein